MEVLTYILLFVTGTVFGSFFSMLSWRFANNFFAEHEDDLIPIWDFTTRSKCTECSATLPWYRLIPIFSWLYSKGKCHACGCAISPRYPLIELVTGILTACVYYKFGFTFEGLVAIIFVYFMIILSIIDIEYKILPDDLVYPFLWAGLLINATWGTFTSAENAIYGAVMGYLILWTVGHVFLFVTGRTGMGFGDFKFLAGFGAWFGYELLYQIIVVSSVFLVLIVFAHHVITNSKSDKDKVVYYPFGPFLALSGLVTLFFGSLL